MTSAAPSDYFTIRLARIEDSDELAALATQLGYPTTAQQINERFAQIAADPNDAIYVAQLPDGELAGFTHVFTAKRLITDSFAELGALVVDNTKRGLGIGAELVRKAEQWATDNKLTCMRIRSNRLRMDAKGFYLHLGYDLSKTQNVFSKHLQ